MVNWNLYLESLGEDTYKIVMPRESDGQFDKLPTTGFAVKWPINPWLTGVHSIAIILQGTDQFKGSNFVNF